MKSIIQFFLHCFHVLTLVYPWSFMSKKNRRVICNISDKNEHFLFMFILVNIFCLLPQIYPSGLTYTIKFFFLLQSYSSKIFQNVSVNAQCLSGIDGTPTKNILMAVPVTMNSTLDNAGVQDPLLNFIFKLRCNSVYYFADNKKITSNYYPFPQLSSFL